MPKQNGNITLFTESSTAKFYVVFMVAATYPNKNFTMWDERSNDTETTSCLGFKRPSGAIEVRAIEEGECCNHQNQTENMVRKGVA